MKLYKPSGTLSYDVVVHVKDDGQDERSFCTREVETSVRAAKAAAISAVRRVNPTAKVYVSKVYGVYVDGFRV